MRRLLAAAMTALLFAALCGCGARERLPAASQTAVPEPPAAPPTKEELADEKLDTLLSSMTLEERVGQLFFVRCPSENAVEDVSAYHLGGYILFGRDTLGRTQTSSSRQSKAIRTRPIPLFRC